MDYGISGRNLRLSYRFPGGVLERIQEFAKELVGLKPDVIFASNTPSVVALLHETHTIPIIFANLSDPLDTGLCQAWHTLVETSRGSRHSSIRWSVSGLRFSGKQSQTSPVSRFYLIRTRLLTLENISRNCGLLELLLE